MKILNLYAGIGGNRKLWGNEHEITAVELNQEIANIYKDFFPNDKIIVADAHKYLLDNFDNFDFVWTSPPCPTHSVLQSMIIHNTGKISYPEMGLYQEIIILKNWFKGKFCVENVNPYYTPLIHPTQKIHRHLYWTNFNIGNFNVTDERKHTDIKSKSNVYGFNVYNTDIKDKAKSLRNMVDPKLGQYILDCAMNVRRQENVKQTTLF